MPHMRFSLDISRIVVLIVVIIVHGLWKVFNEVKIGGNFPKTRKLNSKSWIVGLGDAAFLPYLPVITISLS